MNEISMRPRGGYVTGAQGIGKGRWREENMFSYVVVVGMANCR